MPTARLDLSAPAARLVVLRAQTGDTRALDAVLRALQDPLHTHIAAIVGDADAAQDILQDTLLIVARKISRLRDARWVRAWAYRIATREAVRHARRDRRLAWSDDTVAELAEVPDESREDPAFEPEITEQLPALVASLPPASGAVLRMHYLEGMTYVEIAEALEISVGTVKSRLAYGLKTARRRLGTVSSRESQR